jgi:F0F1-type ATP synthase membrane subunit b/b'
VFVPVIEVMERREARIQTALAQQAEAESQLHAAQQKAAEILDAAHRKAAQITESRKAELNELRRERIARATADADAILATGRAEAAALREAEQSRLAEELNACANQTLARMIDTVDPAALRFVLKRVLASKEAG